MSLKNANIKTDPIIVKN